MLKPVDDTRMFEKMAQSLAATGQYEIHIIGYPSRETRQHPGVHFHPSRTFNRLSPYRLLIPYFSYAKAVRLNPCLVIITTHELLMFAWLLKLTTRCNIVYDVRENYLRNILFLSTFPLVVRPFLAIYVRIKEIVNTPFISRFILSDIGYQDELTFMRKKSIVIENKVKKSAICKARPLESNELHIRLLFSGTLATSTGIFTAIDLARRLHEIDQRISLEIIGYCPKPDVLHQIKSAIENTAFIRLTGGDQLVPHETIMEAIGRSHFGIISYPPNPSTRNTMPTKLFEYIGSCLPILLIDYAYWVEQCRPYSAAIPFDPKSIEPRQLLEEMLTKSFYEYEPGPGIYWESEADRFVNDIRIFC